MSHESRIGFLKHARKWRDFVLDLIFPIECLGCGAEREWLCQKCFSKIRINKTQHCFHCKKEKTFGRFCSKCQEPYYLDGVLIAGDYDDKLIADSIKNLKYKFVKEMAAPLSDFLIIFIHDLLQRNAPFISDLNKESNELFKNRRSLPKILLNFKDSLIIPIPLHPRRLRWRGFNQAEVIARGIAKHFSLELRNDILLRAKYNKPQVKLNKEKRLENIKGCFNVAPLIKGDRGILSNRNIFLIDDVATTGATLNEAARVLKASGAGEVWGLVVAKG